ncbi:stage III sporulation protein AH [Anoxybacillus vitaminiphilus]|uniref:Stage III sporulation protein AH n=1 Tax=Paranoxybacillus vitaminiphilus TaxID=581036 RepID=A0A327YML1_9BACL|nr:SpoIIIAH-like family protein [Anoxybacillus vitaminiphilus]RAK22334.1 stage III sporulation protein AH [Anoxybacillus vitaminiphilus]
MLKKQTVWLLTMLSLVVVLSVYYVTTPEGTNENIAFVNQTEETKEKTTETNSEAKVTVEETEDGKVTSGIASDEIFTALRMQIEDERNKLREELNAIVASTEATAEQKSEAFDKIQKLADISEKEAVLETLIKSKGYEEVLVRVDNEEVRVTVKAKEHSKQAANEIIQLVEKEIGEAQDVAVEFQPQK